MSETPARRAISLTRSGVIGNSSPGTPEDRSNGKPSYYDIPLLKASEWTWMIPVYFALGGLAGGSYVLARLADRFGGDALRPAARAGTVICASSLACCPPLLILDLGDQRRFHHMLRVFKPISPMSVGSWTITAFSGAVGAAVLREWLGARSLLMRIALVPADLAGIPLGLLMTGYTAVLISTTSTPVWAQNPWLGPLFTASAFELAGGSISLALELTSPSETPAAKALKPVKLIARVTTAAALAAYLVSAGKLAKPLTHGKYAPHIWGGALGAGIVLPLALETLADRTRSSSARKSMKIAASVLGLVGGFALKWAIGSAGHISGKDPEAARQVTGT
ncbi:MAG: polysulfide reductase NrfD [Chloroflexi bacterium]|nr:polysulfide reductase NrfD [Chloroflexota bacterium]